MNLMAGPNRIIDGMLDAFRGALSDSWYETTSRWFLIAASFAAPALAVLGLLAAVVQAIRADSFIIFTFGVGWALIVAVGYYIGEKFTAVCETAIGNNPSTISNKTYLDVSALIAIIALIAALVTGIFSAIKLSMIAPLVTGIFTAIAMLYLICLLLRPALINVAVTETSTAGEDALSIFVLVSKMLTKLAPIAFGALTVAGALYLLVTTVNMIEDGYGGIFGYGLQSVAGIGVFLYGLLYPLIAYLVFIFTYLLVDIARAILVLPRKLDRTS